MKNIFKLMFLSLALIFIACNSDENFDGPWQDKDGQYKDLIEVRSNITKMKTQLEILKNIENGSNIVTGFQDDGNVYKIYYKDDKNVERLLEINKTTNANPVIGVEKDSDGKYYYTLNNNGVKSWLLDENSQKIPLSGNIPDFNVDKDGYWTLGGDQPLNGTRLKDANGNEIYAQGTEVNIFTKVETNGNNLVFTLANGETITVPINMSLEFDVSETVYVDNMATDTTINYTYKTQVSNPQVSIVNANALTATLDESTQKIKVTFPSGFTKGSVTVKLTAGADELIKTVYFEVAAPTGIVTPQDMMDFAEAVNNGESLYKYTIDGEITLMNDIDMTGIDWNEYMIGGAITGSTDSYTMGANVFNGIFNGKGFTLKNLNWTIDLADGSVAHGLFSALGKDGVIKDLNIDGEINLSGDAPDASTNGSFAGYCEGTIQGCTNKADINFIGTDASNNQVMQGGIVGYLMNGTIESCVNKGKLTCSCVENTANGSGTGYSQGGIAGKIKSATIQNSTNDGDLNAPSGRGGGIIGIGVSGSVTLCVNNGFVQDDVNGCFTSSSKYGYKRMGGLAGGTSSGLTLTNCTNNGNVFSQNGCRTGGFVGHNEGKINGCTNNGIILSVSSTQHGAGWACGYNKTKANITNCKKGGQVGDYASFGTNPSAAPGADDTNAIYYNNATAYDPSLNDGTTLTEYDDAYYNWTSLASETLADGVTYEKFKFTNISSNLYVVTVDLSKSNVSIETVISNDICPNPNANANSNNGKNIRETVSETCLRRRSEGRNIVAGINSGFFDSNYGFGRGIHIEDNEPVFVNNPDVRARLVNHTLGFTFFEDRTVSFDSRVFSGHVKSGTTEIEYYSINDTVLMLNSTLYDANIYTSRFKAVPHADHPEITNKVGSKALFIVAHCTQNLGVNIGYINAKITSVVDGRNGGSITIPYVTDRTDFVLQLTGAAADKMANLKVGDDIQFKADLKIGNQTKKIKMHNASMGRFLKDGNWNSNYGDDKTTIKPSTVVGADVNGTIVKLVCVDGTSSSGSGADYYMLYMIMKKLGMYNAIRFDGGGSTSMWKYKGSGEIVCKSSDSKGDERSCLNYIHVRVD